MNWRWLIFDYVPPTFELPARQRREARARAFWLMLEAMWKAADEGWKDDRPLHAGRSRAPLRARLPIFSLILFILAASWGLRLGDPLVAAWGVGWGVAAAVALPVMALWAAIVVIGACSMRSHVITAIRNIGYDVCPSCWYRLDGQAPDQARCPECGGDSAASSLEVKS